MRVLVAGGAGFIGSHFVEFLVTNGHTVTIADALTYAGHRENLNHIPPGGFEFHHMNITDAVAVGDVLQRFRPEAVVNFAAETHVDRSITGPSDFINTNVVGTSVLLAESLKYFEHSERPKNFRYLQVSTDEVYGSLNDDVAQFSETTPYAPNSPYSASKAGADFLVRAWFKTYGLPTLITQCSNNYGPRQFPEKLIPAMITRALNGNALGVYGDGSNVRDWLHVSDHCQGIWLTLKNGVPGEHYCFGGGEEMTNLTLVHELCDILGRLRPRNNGDYRELIEFVPDRLGHDYRYSIDCSRAMRELGYKPKVKFREGFEQTIRWYLDNTEWCRTVARKMESK